MSTCLQRIALVGASHRITRPCSEQRQPDGRLAIADTKTHRSKRVIPMPPTLVVSLQRRQQAQRAERERAADRWHESDLVFTTGFGTPIHPRNDYRTFRRLIEKAEHDKCARLRRVHVEPDGWAPPATEPAGFVQTVTKHRFTLESGFEHELHRYRVLDFESHTPLARRHFPARNNAEVTPKCVIDGPRDVAQVPKEPAPLASSPPR